MNSADVKKLLYSLGADLCGIASPDRFGGAPKGYQPTDVFPCCQSVISFAVRFPAGALLCKTNTVYTHIRNTITPKMDAIALNACIELEKAGHLAVPIPTNDSSRTKTPAVSAPSSPKSTPPRRRDWAPSAAIPC